jgi:hypothetical protein
MKITITPQVYHTQDGSIGRSWAVSFDGKPIKVFYSFEEVRRFLEERGMGVSFFLAN